MSVVIGLVDTNTVIMATDKRMSNLTTGYIDSETETKYFIFNQYLSVGFSGNTGLCYLLVELLTNGRNATDNQEIASYRMEDMVEIIDHCIQEIRNHPIYQPKYILNVMICGRQYDNRPAIKITNSVQNPLWETVLPINNQLLARIMQPEDLSLKRCNTILAEELKKHTNSIHALQSAVKRINSESKLVSASSDIWVCH